ncbi:MAG: cytochrome c oxidase subunit II [Cytophagales bacterium]|nr:cytochrome c oxidase subunit II [Cytophagales bacterium]
MVVVIGILALLFLVLTVLVIGKTQDLLKGVKGEEAIEDENANDVDKANDWNAIGLFVFWIISAVGVVWSYFDAKKDFLPEASSPHGRETDYWFWVSMAVIMLAFFVVNTLLFYFPFKYKYNKDSKATFYPHNNKLEVIWTVIPALIMAGLVFTGLRVWNKVMDDAPEDAEVVEIMGRQFAWAVRYPGVDDNELGNYDFRLMDDASGNSFGIDYTDPKSFDDFTNGTEMHIPKGKPVLLKIRARDVLHSVFIPHMRVKMDAVPGMPTKFWFVADKSTEDMRAELNNPDFNYEIACTEVCGRSHFGMKLILVVDEPEDYEAWKKEQTPFLTQNPGFIEKVPANLKARALKYTQGEEEVALVTEVTEEVVE